MKSDDEIIKTIHEDRRYQNCLCCVCKKVSKCTPTNDFYQTEDHGEELVCESCFRDYTGYKIHIEKWVKELAEESTK